MKLQEWFGKTLFVVAVSGAMVNNIPEHCPIRQGFANCSVLGITHLPLDLPQALVGLDASNNQLTDLQWPLPYFHLTFLNVSRNTIQRIRYQAFLHLFSLNLLDLSYNNIKNLSHIESNYTFSHTPQLVHLILRGNPIKSLGSDPIRSNSIRTLNVAECDIRRLEGETSLHLMPNLQRLNLEKNPLGKMDVLISESLEQLYLSETQIRYIKPEFYMGLSRLKHLEMSNNFYLTSLSRTGIATSSSLRVLKVEFCSLENIQVKGMPRLEELYFRGNRIDRIGRGDFSNSGRLTVLDLSKNWIHHIDPMGFEGSLKLVRMDLSGNKVFDFGGSLSLLPRLTYLNVSDNPLFSIDGVEHAPLLTVLDASHCEITYLPMAFFTLQDIEMVNLSRNAIWSLPPGLSSFTLLELNLGYNRLTEVENIWFKHFPRLKTLRLEGNRLTESFHPDMLKRLEHVKFYLSDNPWRCNCGEERYRNFYHHLSSKHNSHSLICHGPENVTGLTWESACFLSEGEASLKRIKKNAWLPMVIAAVATFGIVFMLYLLMKKTSRSDREAPRDVQTVSQSTPTPTPALRTPPRQESRLPTYEEALLMPKPKTGAKSNADTQTQESFLGSVRSLDSRSKKLIHSPSSSSL